MSTRMEVFELTVDHQTDDPVVVLKAEDGITTLPIRIDLMEAGAIAAVHVLVLVGGFA